MKSGCSQAGDQGCPVFSAGAEAVNQQEGPVGRAVGGLGFEVMDTVAADFGVVAVHALAPEVDANDLIRHPDGVGVEEDCEEDGCDDQQKQGGEDISKRKNHRAAPLLHAAAGSPGGLLGRLLERLAELLAVDGMGDVEAATEELVRTFEMADGKQADDVIAKGETEGFVDLVLLEAFHGSGVVAEGLGGEEHEGDGEHDLLVEPAVHLLAGEAGEVVGDGAAGLDGIALGHAACEALVEHEIEIAAPAVGVSAGNDDD